MEVDKPQGVPQPTRSKKDAGANKINLDILRLIQSSRQTYGLRTNDYARYHSHCVRRIATLHRSTNTQNRSNVKGKATNVSKKKGKTSTAAAAATAGKKASSTSASTNATNFASTTAKIQVEAVLKDNRLLEILIWESERAWAEGMRSREEVAQLERSNASGSNGYRSLSSKRHHSNRRLLRASQHADKLTSLLRSIFSGESLSTTNSDGSQAGVTASSLLQAEAYSLYISGTYSFALASSATSSSLASAARRGADQLSSAYVLLEDFGKNSVRATEEALAFELLDELEPMIRFCAYKADISDSTLTVAELARSIGQPIVETNESPQKWADLLKAFEAEEQQAIRGRKGAKKVEEAVKSLQWRDVDIPIRSAELSAALARVQRALASARRTSSTRKGSKSRKSATSGVTIGAESGQSRAMVDYDKALATLSEAQETARKLVEDNATALAKAQSARFEAATKPLAIAYSYITYQLLTLRIERDESLMATMLAKLAHREAKFYKDGRPSASGTVPVLIKRRRAKTYPILIKLLDGILQSLEQLRELDVVEEDGRDLAGRVDCTIAFDKARRCLYLGQTYGLIDRYPEALTLFQRASLYIRQSRSLLSSMDEDDEDNVQALEVSEASLADLEGRLTAAEGRSEKDWFTYRYAKKIQDEKALDEAVQGLAIAADSGKRKKAGPLFFDVAYNYVASIDIDLLQQAADGVTVATQVPAASQMVQAEHDKPVVTQAMEAVVDKAKEAVAAAPAPEETSASPSRGIWGFFGRGKK